MQRQTQNAQRYPPALSKPLITEFEHRAMDHQLEEAKKSFAAASPAYISLFVLKGQTEGIIRVVQLRADIAHVVATLKDHSIAETYTKNGTDDDSSGDLLIKLQKAVEAKGRMVQLYAELNRNLLFNEARSSENIQDEMQNETLEDYLIKQLIRLKIVTDAMMRTFDLLIGFSELEEALKNYPSESDKGFDIKRRMVKFGAEAKQIEESKKGRIDNVNVSVSAADIQEHKTKGDFRGQLNSLLQEVEAKIRTFDLRVELYLFNKALKESSSIDEEYLKKSPLRKNADWRKPLTIKWPNIELESKQPNVVEIPADEQDTTPLDTAVKASTDPSNLDHVVVDELVQDPSVKEPFPLNPGQHVTTRNNPSLMWPTRSIFDHPSKSPATASDFVVDIFSGDDDYTIDEFLNDFLAASAHFAWCDQQKFIHSKRFIGGTAKQFLRVVKAQSWPNVHRHLLAEFKQTIPRASLLRSLRDRRRGAFETVRQYVVAMRRLAATGNGVGEADVVRCIVAELGRKDEKKRRFLTAAVSYGTLRTLLDQFDNYETIEMVDKSNKKM